MIGSFIIVLREILEAALVIGVVAAALKGMARRALWVAVGTGLGMLGAALVAASIGAISSLAQGTGQELFQTAVLFGAGLLLAGHNIWMASHGRELTARMQALGGAVLTGSESVWVMVGVTSLAVMREGSEIALFLYGMAAGGVGRAQLLAGGALGLAAGVAAGVLLFAGLSRIPVSRLFQASGLIILFIAAGMIARGAQFLVQAGWLPALVSRVWDSSAFISGNGVIGRSLGALAGYTPAPSLMQLLFWAGSLITIGGLMAAKSGRLRAWRSPTRRSGLDRPAQMLLLLSVSIAALRSAAGHAADYQVYPPYVNAGENEIEARAYTSGGAGPESDSVRAVKFAAGRGITNWWASEFYLEAEQEFGETLKLEEFEWENRFQLTPQGRYPVDIGLLNENEIPRFGGDPYQLAIGPTLERDFGRLVSMLDLLAVHQYGANATPGMSLQYRAHVEYRWRRNLTPLAELYASNSFGASAVEPAQLQLGPGVGGQLQLGPARSLNWAVVALFGGARASPSATLLLRAEYEFY